MKTSIILFSLIICFSFEVPGQDYFPFPIENVNWNVYLLSTCDDYSPPDTFLLRYTLHGDTTINDEVYMKLCLEKGDTISPIVIPIGGLRESEKKIYFIGQDYELSDHYEEVLLYDFTKQVGDTIIHDIYGTLSSIIEGIDSILIGEEYRKMYTVNTGWIHYPDYIIEGIGSIKNGLLGHITNTPTCGYHYWEHICFRENGQVEFLNPAFTDCFPAYLLSSLNAIPELSEIKIFPNPFINQLYIENIPVNANLNLQIINATGQEILSRKLISPNDIITKFMVKGLYIINIRDIKGKIIKNEKLIRE